MCVIYCARQPASHCYKKDIKTVSQLCVHVEWVSTCIILYTWPLCLEVEPDVVVGSVLILNASGRFERTAVHLLFQCGSPSLSLSCLSNVKPNLKRY